MFQDDDFPLFGRVWKRWTRALIAELYKADLPGRAIWKINCRADAIDEEHRRRIGAAVFCRMLPYDGTPIKDRLAAEGRLRGDVCDPDYEFPRLHGFHAELERLMKLSGWIHGHQALSRRR